MVCAPEVFITVSFICIVVRFACTHLTRDCRFDTKLTHLITAWRSSHRLHFVALRLSAKICASHFFLLAFLLVLFDSFWDEDKMCSVNKFSMCLSIIYRC